MEELVFWNYYRGPEEAIIGYRGSIPPFPAKNQGVLEVLPSSAPNWARARPSPQLLLCSFRQGFAVE